MSDAPTAPLQLTPDQVSEQLRQAPPGLASKTYNVADQLAQAAAAAGGLPADTDEDTRQAWITATRRRVLAETIGALAGCELGARRATANGQLLADLEGVFDALMVAADEPEPEPPHSPVLSEATADAAPSENEIVGADNGTYIRTQAVYADADGNAAPDTPYKWVAAFHGHSISGEADTEAEALEAAANAISDMQALTAPTAPTELPENTEQPTDTDNDAKTTTEPPASQNGHA